MQQNIDQLFKDGVEGLESSPAGINRNPDANWARIEAMMAPEKKRRGAAWIWMGIAAGAMLLIVSVWGIQRLTQHDSGSPEQLQPHELAKVEANSSDSLVDLMEENQLAMTDAERSGLQKVQQGSIRMSGDHAVEPPPPPPMVEPTLWANNEVVISANIPKRNMSNSYASLYSIQQADVASIAITSSKGKKRSSKQSGAKQSNKVADNVAPSYFGLKGQTETQRRAKTKEKKGKFGFGDVDDYGTESYAETVENDFFSASEEPLSTFSIDVDRASYTNHRRFIEQNQLPPKYSVRVEEFINYFNYEYPQPHGDVPFSILPEVTTCPWNTENKLVRIALKGKEVSNAKVPPSNIVFLLDVSGSMGAPDKLPLLKQALGMLTEQLREQDKVSIVVYAGAAGLVLPPTSGNNKQVIMAALDRLESGGSTAGGAGIELAYATAKENYFRGGNNRVILATDGDFNVGVSDNGGLEELIVRKREEGVFLSVLGFGEGNLQDSKMELLADKGNGNYNYIDSDREAKKVLVTEFGGTLLTIAKDVKIQVEFNPAQVASYRLVGYENRKLRNEDFANDKIDAGELGAGHTVTALYEVVPAGRGNSSSGALKYQKNALSTAAYSNELLTVKLRYKEPQGTVSKLLEQVLVDDGRNIAQTTNDFRWAVAVAEYGLLLRESEYKGNASFEQVLALARSAMGADKEGYRKEFIELVGRAVGIQQAARGGR